MKLNRLFLIATICASCFAFAGCSSITLSKDEAYYIKDYIEFSHKYIEDEFNTNHTGEPARIIEPVVGRYKTAHKIIEKWDVE